MYLINPYRFCQDQYYLFDGSTEYLNIPNDDTLSFNYNDAFSVSVWINISSLASDSIIFGKQQSSGDLRGYRIKLLTSGVLSFSCVNGASNQSEIRTNSGISTGTWYHVVVTKSTASAASGLSIYIDGSVASTFINTDTLGSNDITNTENLGIAARGDGSLPYNGNIDEVSVFNTELTSSDVTDIYNAGRSDANYKSISGLVSHWNMEYDIFDGTNWNILDQVTQTWTTFDGINEYVDCGNDSSLDFNYNDAFSISYWVYRTGGDSFIVTKQQDSGNFIGYNTRFFSGGEIGIQLRNGSNQLNCRTISTFSNDMWHHVVITKDTSSAVSGVNIYVNGVNESLSTIADTLGTSSISNSLSFKIGVRGTTTLPFNGYLDEVGIWDKELTSGEVTTIYEEGRYNNDYSNITNLLSQWKLNTLNTSDQEGVNNGTSINMDSTNILDDINDGTSNNMDINNKICE